MASHPLAAPARSKPSKQTLEANQARLLSSAQSGNIVGLRVAGREKIVDFARDHADARAQLYSWVAAVETTRWKTPRDVRESFRTVDFVGNKSVFNVAGNKYRLIAMISYSLGIVSVQDILSHKDYDKGKWK